MRNRQLFMAALICPLILSTGCPDDGVAADTEGDSEDGTTAVTTMQPTTMQPTTMTTMTPDDTGSSSGNVDTTMGDDDDDDTTTMGDDDDDDTTTMGDDDDDDDTTGTTGTTGTTDGSTGTTDGSTGTTDGTTGTTDGSTGTTDGSTGTTDGTTGTTDGSTGTTDGSTGTTDGTTGTTDGSTGTTDGSTGTTGTTGTTGGMPGLLCSTPSAQIGPDIADPQTVDTITVGGLTGFVDDVNIVLDANHTFVGDLEIDITHVDSGVTVRIADNQCGGADDILATFDDDAAAGPACMFPAITGDVLPFQSLIGLAGIADPTGDWQITITDTANGDGGTLNEWCLDISTTDMDPNVCGDGILTGGEECDTDQFGGLTCADVGMFDNGTLACDPMTCTVDSTGCGLCGDMMVNGDEDCDSGDLAGATCADAGFSGGGMVACNDATCEFDTTMCMGAECGDSVIEMPEVCDTNELAGGTCEGQGFVGGSLDCLPLSCGYDTSECADDIIAICSGPVSLPFDNMNPLNEVLSSMDMGNVADVDVYVDITHTFSADIDMQIRHVDSDTIVDLVFDDCIADDDLHAFFNDEGNGPADCIDPIGIEGNITPETPLSALDGLAIGSDWELIVVDDAGGDNGTLNEWCVYVTPM